MAGLSAEAAAIALCFVNSDYFPFHAFLLVIFLLKYSPPGTSCPLFFQQKPKAAINLVKK
jgi:hypothetical protein